MRAPVQRSFHWLTPLLLLAACIDGRTGGADPSDDRDGGSGNIAASVKCGERMCHATTTDARWGAEPCCLPDAADADEPCGLQADEPQLSYAGVQVPISDILEDAKAQGQAIVNTQPVVECLPRNQPGTPDDACPNETIGAVGVDGGVADAGADAMPYEVAGCCRDDGMCGYVDPATDFGCVLISKSIVGQALGRADQRCD